MIGEKLFADGDGASSVLTVLVISVSFASTRHEDDGGLHVSNDERDTI